MSQQFEILRIPLEVWHPSFWLKEKTFTDYDGSCSFSEEELGTCGLSSFSSKLNVLFTRHAKSQHACPNKIENTHSIR
ncbi:hypothetical protein CEXT_209501 [Caerostris extrusa]|uniref:Uncharacterized protein n=1 Tax=Caerostris extrusa TaxID=172846 RepID=A0AAV4Y8T6_CAEEX|nr:hypothetical protein CEXT_209501 [Caerostris extrusa]